MKCPLAVSAVLLFSLLGSADAADVYERAWSIDGFFDQRDYATEIAIGAGGDIYLGGRTGEVYGTPATDLRGGLAAKYSGDGAQQWLTKAYQGRGLEHVQGIAVDPSGAVYISGETYRYAAGAEAFLIKYDNDGNRLWERHLGSPDNEFGRELVIDSQGAVYMTGSTTGQIGEVEYGGYDPFLTKHTPDGGHVWTRQYDRDIGTQSRTVAIDSQDNLYLAGSGSLGGASLSQLDSEGDVVWTRYPEYSDISGRTTSIGKVGVDPSGNVYTVGSTNQLYVNGRGFIEADAYVAKHDSEGDFLWSYVFQNDTVSGLSGIAFDAEGSVYVSGSLSANSAGVVRDSADAFWGKLTPDGTLVTTEVFGTERNDFASGVVVDPSGRVFIAGATSWNVNGYFAGEQDAFLVRFDPIPEPCGIACLIPVVSVMMARSGRGRT